jgi:Holliday junction resolvase RusA-like endonuclease
MKRTITVMGKPRPQGSLRTLVPVRGSKPTIVPADSGVYRYRADIQAAFVRKYGEPKPLEGPIVLHAVFVFRRPDNHYYPEAKTKGRKARTELRPTAPGIHYISTPDVDKLVRAVGDSLTGFAYDDDKQVSSLWADKRWGDADMTIIDILTPGQDEEDAKNGLV